MKYLKEEINTLSEGASLNGSKVFKLYDTYGFPVDLTADILKDKKIKLDYDGFESAMQEQKKKKQEQPGVVVEKKDFFIYFGF